MAVSRHCIRAFMAASSAGSLHLGHYFGTLASRVVLQDQGVETWVLVADYQVITDRDTGRPRGFGFVEMGNSEHADQAIRDLNGHTFDGRQLNVNEARERTSGPRGGGGGGGGGRRGGW